MLMSDARASLRDAKGREEEEKKEEEEEEEEEMKEGEGGFLFRAGACTKSSGWQQNAPLNFSSLDLHSPAVAVVVSCPR